MASIYSDAPARSRKKAVTVVVAGLITLVTLTHLA